MKEEALKAHDEVVKGADVALYDAGFADGQAGAQASGITQEQMDAAVTAAKAEGEKSGYEKGVASVPVPVPGGTFDQAAMDKYADSKVEQAIAALPADVTPYSEEDMQALKDQVKVTEAIAAKATANDEQQEADKAKLLRAITAIDALVHSIATPKEEATLPEGAVKA